MESCKNCGHSIKSDQKYCPECGQKNRDKLSFKVLMGELASTFLSWDSKFFKTIVPLIIKPGRVSKEYLAGKRMSFVAPLRLYLFFSVLFFFTLTMAFKMYGEQGPDVQIMLGEERFEMDRDSLSKMVREDRLDELPAIKNAPDNFQRKLYKKMLIVSADAGSFGQYIQKNISIMLFFFLPAFGLILWLFFMNRKLDYIEHLIYGVYYHSFFFFMLWFTFIIAQLLSDMTPIYLGILYMLIYLVIGIRTFYDHSWGMATIKAIFIGLVYFITFTIFVVITLTASVFLF